MILDSLRHAGRYFPLHTGFLKAFAYIAATDLAGIAPGRYTIENDAMQAIVADENGKGRPGRRLEAHRAYIDIQYVVAGVDLIGWSPHEELPGVLEPYDGERDIEFLSGDPRNWIELRAGMFAVFFPEDAHAPLAGTGAVRKVVVKVPLKEFRD